MTSTHTALPELQAAIYTKLTGDSTLMALITGVFDFGAVATSQPFPYVTIGDATEAPENAFGTRGYDDTQILTIWSQARGYKELQTILARMNDLLDQQPLTLATQHHVYTLLDFAQPIDDPDGITHHLVVRYRTFTQEM